MLSCPKCHRCYVNKYPLTRHMASIHGSQECESDEDVSEKDESEADTDTEDEYTYDDVRAILRYFRLKNRS